MLSLIINTPQEVMLQLSLRFKERRLLMHLTRKGLAIRADVSESSLKRFETTGMIALESLLKLSLVLNCLEDFDLVARQRKEAQSLDEILAEKKIPKKGSIT